MISVNELLKDAFIGRRISTIDGEKPDTFSGKRILGCNLISLDTGPHLKILFDDYSLYHLPVNAELTFEEDKKVDNNTGFVPCSERLPF